MILWEYGLAAAGKIVVAMDRTEKLFRGDEEINYNKNENWGASEEEDDIGATKLSSECDERSIKTRASDKRTIQCKIWKHA